MGLIAVFYALSSWLLGVAAGPNTIVNPEALVKAGFETDGAPDPCCLSPGPSGWVRSGARRRRSCSPRAFSRRSCRSTTLSPATPSPSAARAFAVFGRVNSRTGAPWVASLTQSILALTVVLVFAIAAANPVLTLFTWLTNLGALGVLLLMAATSFAVVGYFRRRPQDAVGSWAATWAPAIAGVLLLVLLVLGVASFNVLITGLTDAPIDTMTIVLPVILFGGGIVGLIVGAVLKRSRPDVYERIGGGAGVEE